MSAVALNDDPTTGTAVPIAPRLSTADLHDAAVRVLLAAMTAAVRRHDHDAVRSLSAALTAIKESV